MRLGRAVALVVLIGLVSACSRGATTNASPAQTCPAQDVLEAVHGAAFHFEHGDVATARAHLETATRGIGPGVDPTTTAIMRELAAISALADDDRDGRKVGAEEVRVRLSDWPCLDDASHDRFHTRLPAIEGRP